jgi:ferric-dicitrate binding protein FerR (iron transport regulator)
MKTTLLEGSVKVLSANNKESIIIKPGEQAIAAPHSALTIFPSTDLAEVMAWKNGRFRFTGNSVEEIFAQLSRWYDIDVVYEDKIPDEFVANISRDVPLSKVLTLFEMTKQIKFKIDGKKVIVMK